MLSFTVPNQKNSTVILCKIMVELLHLESLRLHWSTVYKWNQNFCYVQASAFVKIARKKLKPWPIKKNPHLQTPVLMNNLEIYLHLLWVLKYKKLPDYFLFRQL